MKSASATWAFALIAASVLVSSCAVGEQSLVGHPAYLEVSPPTYLAQSAGADCRPGDSSMVCCIKKFPLTPIESCGATAVEVAEVLNGAKTLNEAAQTERDDAAEAAKESAEDDPDEGWREHCRDTYVLCRDQKKPRWVGDCYSCFRYCEGQRQWPFDLCYPNRR